MSTVDAFQGGEKGVIFLSCVRTRQVGFIDSDKFVFIHNDYFLCAITLIII